MTRTPVLRRTVVHVDSVADGMMTCLVAGLADRDLRALVPVAQLPASMQATATPGSLFFAYVNLNAQTTEQIQLERIEEGWASTDLENRPSCGVQERICTCWLAPIRSHV